MWLETGRGEGGVSFQLLCPKMGSPWNRPHKPLSPSIFKLRKDFFCYKFAFLPFILISLLGTLCCLPFLSPLRFWLLIFPWAFWKGFSNLSFQELMGCFASWIGPLFGCCCLKCLVIPFPQWLLSCHPVPLLTLSFCLWHCSYLCLLTSLNDN